MSKKTKKKQNSGEVIFEEKDIVGARVKGYPLWPGFIEKVEFNSNNNKRKYTVRFYGTNDTSQSIAELKYFKDFTPKEKACNKKGFKEALIICQKEYDASLRLTENVVDNQGVKDDGDNVEINNDKSSTVSPTSAQDPIEVPQNPVVQKQKNARLKKNKDAIITPRRQSSRKKVDIDQEKDQDQEPIPPSTTAPELVEPVNVLKSEDVGSQIEVSKEINEHETTKSIPPKSPKLEGENNLNEISKQETLAKLKGKLERKQREKEARKSKKKEKKLSSKMSAKLVLINKNLKRFSELSRKLSISDPTQNDRFIAEWKPAVQMFLGLLPVLDKCITYTKDRKVTDLSESRQNFKECHDYLIEINSNLKAGKDNENLHGPVKIKLSSCIKGMKNHESVRYLIRAGHDSLMNAMIERKENDVK